MGKQDTLRNLLIAGAVFLLIMSVGPALFPPAPPPPLGSTVAPASSDRPTDAMPQTAPPPLTAEGPPTATETPANVAEPSFAVVEAESVTTFEMGAAEDIDTRDRTRPSDPYRMRLVLANVGAAVESATLTDHAATLNSPDRYQLLAPAVRTSGVTHRSLSIDRINIDGVDLSLHDKNWRTDGVKIEPLDGNGEKQSITFTLDILKEGAAVLQLQHSYRLPKQPTDLGRHDLSSDIAVSNLSNAAHRVILTYRGGLGVPQSNPRDDRVIDVGIQNAPGQVAGARKMQTEVTTKAGQNVPLYAPNSAAPDQRLAWAATGNTYFTCTLAPLAPDGKAVAATLAEVSAFDADGDAATGDDATLRFITIPANLAPKETIHYATAIYLGEKDGHAFRDQADYRDRNYYYQISQGFGWCTFTWLVELMIWLLNSLYFVVRDFGVAIIILVLIVRAMLHPLTKKGQVNMVRMQHRMGELAPKIEEIKKKFANDKVRMNQEMMKLNINPAGQLMTCLPMFIQMPIWVALFLSLSNNILMRHQPLHFTWIKDLTAPDALIPFASALKVPLFGWQIASFNLLPLLVSVFMYLQQKTQPKPPPNPNLSAEQRQQQEMMQKMMPMMSIMMLLIFYNMPSGLNLYIMFSSLFGWLEQMRIRKHIKEHEAAGTLHKTPRAPDDDSVIGRPRKPGKPSFLERMQKMAADAQKSQKTQRAKPRR